MLVCLHAREISGLLGILISFGRGKRVCIGQIGKLFSVRFVRAYMNRQRLCMCVCVCVCGWGGG